MIDPKEISEIINQIGEDREGYFLSVAPPIIQTSNFAFTSVENFREAMKDQASSFLYSRAANPTLQILEKKLAALDGAEASLLFNSGSGTIFTAVLANVKSGDHIVSVKKPYYWAQRLFDNILPRFNVTTTYVDGKDVQNFKNALQPNTKVIYLETPNSWDFELQDLEAVAKLARSQNILTICDNSYCTPLYHRPLEFGIDLSLQSTTKYINGHSDLVGGVLSGNKEIIEKIFRSKYMNLGISTTPFNAWLMIRGLRTLPIRLERVSASAPKIVAFLKSRPEVEEMIYPFDEDFPQYALAKKQMSGAGGLFSFILKADSVEEIERFCDNLQDIIMAVSWGGYESLIIPGIATLPKEDFDAANKIHRRVRLYVGLEDPDILIEDLRRGLDSMRLK